MELNDDIALLINDFAGVYFGSETSFLGCLGILAGVVCSSLSSSELSETLSKSDNCALECRALGRVTLELVPRLNNGIEHEQSLTEHPISQTNHSTSIFGTFVVSVYQADGPLHGQHPYAWIVG